MIRRRTITSYVWNSVSGNKMVILSNCIRNFFRKFELIGNSTQGENPAPDNPQEIKSAGRKSKNLFNINYFKDKSNLLTIQCEGFSLLGITCNVKPNTKYTLSANLSEAKYNLNIANKATRFSLTSSPARTLISNDDGTLYIGFYGATADNINMDDFMQQYQNIQLEEGNTATCYEAYSDKYLLDLKVTGKNLIKTNPILPKRWSNNIDNHVIEYITLKPHTTYTLAMEEDTKYVNDLRVRIFSKNDMTRWLAEILGASENKKKFTTKDDVECVLCVYHLLDYKGDVKQLQLVEGDISTSYEPYTEQSVQITLDEPLRGIGEYKDTITKDGAVRKIAPYEVNLNDLRDGGYSKTNTVMFSVKVQNKTVGYASSKPSILCNILPDCALQMSNIYNNDKECIAVGGGIVLFRVNKSRLKDISSFEATKQSFIELMADKKMIVEYALETPVTEPLPESAQQQLQALHSENGTTHVLVESGEVVAGINIEYKYKS